MFAVLAALFLIVLYYTNVSAMLKGKRKLTDQKRSSQLSDRTFYEKTVKGMNERAAAKKQAEEGPKLNVQPPEDQQQIQQAAEKSRIQGLKEEDQSKDKDLNPKPDVSTKDAANASPVPGSAKKWDMGDESAKATKDERTEEEKDVEAELNSILKRSPSKLRGTRLKVKLTFVVIIFSKTYCPYSKKAKAIFEKYSITPSPFIVELNEHKMGAKLQDKLEKVTGRRTVPNVLISGHSIGGGDDVGALHEKGELIDKIKSLGGKRIMEIGLKKA